MIFDIEDKINIEKIWIEIGNIICANDKDFNMKLGLILNIIDKQNSEILTKFEDLLDNIEIIDR